MAVPTVYVIDDDAGILRSADFLLRSLGWRFETFSRGEDFLAALDRLEPGCVLTDLQMPSLGGYELRHSLR